MRQHSISKMHDFTNQWYASCLGTQLAFEVSLSNISMDDVHTYMKDLRGCEVDGQVPACDLPASPDDLGDRTSFAVGALEGARVDKIAGLCGLSHMPLCERLFSAASAGNQPCPLVQSAQLPGCLHRAKHIIPMQVWFADGEDAVERLTFNTLVSQVQLYACPRAELACLTHSFAVAYAAESGNGPSASRPPRLASTCTSYPECRGSFNGSPSLGSAC